ncbi:ankyrin repeat domain-containing protein [Cesiribacter sp. SM1]|uniref:ankyrin repeat domain-containing protein n=1 Tax=Cesiribacter sp. SM1 TaxID=2861196 RepID=UPI001CD75F89|nr:ankyrin repeat domain-containing protein [Cesiribacter sp. SM1]
MQSLKFNFMKVATLTLIVAFVIFAYACNSNSENRKLSQSGIAPPDVDLHTATVSGNLDAVKQHIRAGSDLNEKDPFGGSSPLITAAVFGKPEIAKALIDAGADINFQNNDQSTPLITAAFFCRPKIVEMLLEKGADKTMKNKYGATAYESVAAPFGEVKSGYEMMGKALGPMGLQLDYAYIQKTRPVIAEMLK